MESLCHVLQQQEITGNNAGQRRANTRLAFEIHSRAVQSLVVLERSTEVDCFYPVSSPFALKNRLFFRPKIGVKICRKRPEKIKKSLKIEKMAWKGQNGLENTFSQTLRRKNRGKIGPKSAKKSQNWEGRNSLLLSSALVEVTVIEKKDRKKIQTEMKILCGKVTLKEAMKRISFR